MKENLRREILTETYQDMRRLILSNAWKFWKIHGGDLDDLIAEANLIFVDACDSYDPGRGAQLGTWISFRIKKRLISYMRKKGSGYGSHTSIDDHFEIPCTLLDYRGNNFSVMELLDEMEHDTWIVLELFFETPRNILVKIRNKHNRIDHVQAALRNRLRNRLRQMGWTRRRIEGAFDKIKNVINY